MTDEVFNRSLELCKMFERDTDELWLHGCGESLLHPKFLDYVLQAVQKLNSVQIKVSTNGVFLTERIINVFADNNVVLHVSVHKPLPNVAEYFKKALDLGVLEHIGCQPVTTPSNWAGQVDWPDKSPAEGCSWVKNQWACILSDGRISTCCLDVNPRTVIGHVNEPLNRLRKGLIRPIALCNSCHLVPNV
jgi:hypothetical protein